MTFTFSMNQIILYTPCLRYFFKRNKYS